jgi:dipeptidyl aminopeptidase/acylaminoacyl peptidase
MFSAYPEQVAANPPVTSAPMPGLRPADVYLLAHAGEAQVAPDGRHVAYTVSTLDPVTNRARSRVWLVGTETGSAPRPLTPGEGRDTTPRWSPDGGLLAYLSRSGPDGAVSTHLQVLATSGPGQPMTVASWPDEVADVRWSPDGRRLAVVARRRNDRYGPDGSVGDERAAPPRRITTLFSRHNDHGWVVDRPHLLWVVPLDGSAPPRALTTPPHDVEAATWSPDATRLAFTSARHPDWDLDLCNGLYVVPADGGDEPQLVGDITGYLGSPRWSADGRSVLVVRHADPLAGPRHPVVGIINLADGSRRDLGRSLDRAATGAAVWDGDDVIFAVEDHGSTLVLRAPADGSGHPTPLVAGAEVVSSFDAAAGTLAWVASGPVDLPELWVRPPGGTDRRVTDLTAELRARVELAAPVEFTATSGDGAEVQCWAIPPLDVAGPAPTILNIHGGPYAQYGWGLFDEFQYQVAAGFGVVYCNPRGSSGYGEAWARAIRWPEATDPGSGWGGVDHDDVMACIDEAVRRFDWIDPERLGVQGGSYGGYLTSWIVSHGDRFKAACSERAANNLLTLEYHSDIAGEFRSWVGHSHVERPELYRRQSPTTYLERITTPMLLIHSEDDLRCPIDQAEELFVGLRLLGRRPELVRFPAETHELSRSGSPRHRQQRAEIILDFFRTHLADRADL